MTPGNTFGDWNFDWKSSTFVDSAWAGSHEWASFFSAPVNLPASGAASTTTTIQNAKITHLIFRPAGKLIIARALLIGFPRLRSPARCCSRAVPVRPEGGEKLIGAPRRGIRAGRPPDRLGRDGTG